MKNKKQVELNKRGAAAMAHATAGRSRVVPSEKERELRRERVRAASKRIIDEHYDVLLGLGPD